MGKVDRRVALQYSRNNHNKEMQNFTTKTLRECLDYIECVHSSEIDMGLDRVRAVYERLYPSGVSFITISIAGTNGKGSTGAFIHRGLESLGISHGWFSSPHIHFFNERFKINDADASDAMIIDALAQVEQARGDISLSYFEFCTLAAIVLFEQLKVTVALMEVGLGGRLDSTNILENDISIITSIGLDHTEYLGDTLAEISREKSGVMRSHHPVILPHGIHPQVLTCARDIHAKVHIEDALDTKLQLPGKWQQANAALASKAVRLVCEILDVLYDRQTVQDALSKTTLTARAQYIKYQDTTFIIDTAHNPMAVAQLAQIIPKHAVAIFGVMADKDYHAMISAIEHNISHWYLFDLVHPRALAPTVLARELLTHEKISAEHITQCDSAHQVVKHAISNDPETIIVFGSFVTISAILSVIDYN